MHVRGRPSSRHVKGRQVAMTLYLPPHKYWLLKSVSHRTGINMQFLLRRALDAVLADTHRPAQITPQQSWLASTGSPRFSDRGSVA